jgi:hypothetical protein
MTDETTLPELMKELDDAKPKSPVDETPARIERQREILRRIDRQRGGGDDPTAA